MSSKRKASRILQLSILLPLLLALAYPTTGQVSEEAVDQQAVARIRGEAFNHSQIMDIMATLTDVIGPRLTGSPSLKRAQEFARDKLRDWGIPNARLEAWAFGRGWSLEGVMANMTAPSFSPLIAYPKAWSPGTNGTVRGEVVYLDAQTPADVEKFKGKLHGRVVLFSPAQLVKPEFTPEGQRATDEELLKLANAEPPPRPAQSFQLSPEQRAAAELNYRKWQMVYSEGAAVVLEPGHRDAGTVYVTSAVIPSPVDMPSEKRVRPWHPSKPAVIPQAVVAAEQYNRMMRLLARGLAVSAEINLQTRFYDDDPMSYNLIGEIPGTDLKAEIIMIGSSMDSWHAGTGATDNASGAAVALEVMRILQSLGVKPRRTIRVGLWSGEEQGRLGSRAYVAEHLGRKIEDSNNPSGRARWEFQPEYEKVSGYLNLDYGAGRLRGAYLQGNEAARPIFRAALAPLKDLGASTLSISDIGAADHISFDEVGLPGFQFIRDYMEGTTRAPHTNMDVLDHVMEEDLKQSAAVAASLLWHLAMRDAKLPRTPLPTQ